MNTRIIEAVQPGGPANWGKFLVGQFTEEWLVQSAVDTESRRPLLATIGKGPETVFVMDLQTGEGALFRPGGYAPADLNKHRIWVCPMFEPFLTWLYTQDLRDLDGLPALVELEAPFAFAGYRREGMP